MTAPAALSAAVAAWTNVDEVVRVRYTEKEAQDKLRCEERGIDTYFTNP